MKPRLAYILVLTLLLSSHGAWSRNVSPDTTAAALEKRFTTLASELRCLVCQNESIAESNAPLAKDLRKELRAQLEQGKSDETIRTFMVERYGDYVLLSPPVKPATWLLWLGPLLLLGIGVAGFATYHLRSAKKAQGRDSSFEKTRPEA
jgi:cytochrome c-type biogenesis protein CcmH